MYVQGVSTRKVKAITEELCGHSFSASAIKCDEPMARHRSGTTCQPPFLAEAFPYLILEARYAFLGQSSTLAACLIFALALCFMADHRRSTKMLS
jgi:putative transposase